jgi:hypothetical protein
MCEHTPRQQPLVPARCPQTLELRPRPRTPVTHPLSGLEHLGLGTTQKPRPAVPTQREADAAGSTLDVYVDVDVDRQLLTESAGGDSLPDVPLPDVILPDVPLPEARPDGLVSEE